MSHRFLHDAVTLRHFAAARELDVLRDRRAHVAEPRWVAEVHKEIVDARNAGQTSCGDVLAATWLGEPKVPGNADLIEIFKMRTRLGGDDPQHLGEAASIYWSEQLAATFVTDDNSAHAFACCRLGHHRVQDTVDILCEAVANGEISAKRAAEICERLRSLRPEPRHLRSARPDPLTSADFDR